ncbi:hypothetical protein GCM10010430_74020 [Kitasatospora cystarginea]|uniref:Uncharacterized protein n=1 Tax=Kitasatospora cystarginea TaxID=58350 RepID=A0ABN3EYL2_9ACTN
MGPGGESGSALVPRHVIDGMPGHPSGESVAYQSSTPDVDCPATQHGLPGLRAGLVRLLPPALLAAHGSCSCWQSRVERVVGLVRVPSFTGRLACPARVFRANVLIEQGG